MGVYYYRRLYVCLENDKTSWESGKRLRGECKVKTKLDEAGNFLEWFNDYTHVQSETKCKMAKFIANIKRRATEAEDPAQVISGRELEGISEAVAINLAALCHIRNIRLLRQANQQLTNRANIKDVAELSPWISTILHQWAVSYVWRWTRWRW